ncbi:MAG: hypothetical protein JNK26_03910 [Candidatus Doudnabacteria bacterium]|nr:hypothetical protein [Candidatus Doudnabacteria bacterium]
MFLRLFFFTLPFGLISLFVEPLQYVYAFIFFGAGLYLLFTTNLPNPQSLSSAERHLNSQGKTNWLNLGIAIVLCISSLLFVFLQTNKGLLVLALWAIYSNFMLFYLPSISQRLERGLIANYIHSQLPDVALADIEYVVDGLLNGRQSSEVSDARLGQDETAKIQHYFEVYTNRIYSK